MNQDDLTPKEQQDTSAPQDIITEESSAGSPQPKTSFKGIKNDTKRAIKEGIATGAGDEIAGLFKEFLRFLLMTPYDIMNYSLMSFMLLSKAGKRKFVWLTAITTSVFSLACMVLLIKELDITFAFYIVGALIACCLVIVGMSLDGTAKPTKPIKPTKQLRPTKPAKQPTKKPSRKSNKSNQDLGDIYIE